VLKAHHRRGDRDAALAFDRHPIRAHPPPLAQRLAFTRQLDRPKKQQKSLGQGGLAGAGCEMIAKVRRRKISSVRVLIDPLQLSPECGPSPQAVSLGRFFTLCEQRGLTSRFF
jgi:hypothetical protein